MTLSGRDLVAIQDLVRADLDGVLSRAAAYDLPKKGGPRADLSGKVVASLFFEPSTRTRLSFEAAAHRLGARVIGFSGPEATSLVKGETLADTIRCVASWVDLIILRHPKEGAARLAAEVAEVPVVNAGDGAGSHPTQTLTDLYTIQKERGSLEGQRVTLVGDLKYGRTVHSLAVALALYGSPVTLVAPASLRLPREVKEACAALGHPPEEITSLADALPRTDVLYVTRIQKERFPDPSEYAKVAGSTRITPAALEAAPEGVTVMHPLPRVDEIVPEVDRLPNAAYFRQAANGLPVRMAILASILGETP